MWPITANAEGTGDWGGRGVIKLERDETTEHLQTLQDFLIRMRANCLKTVLEKHSCKNIPVAEILRSASKCDEMFFAADCARKKKITHQVHCSRRRMRLQKSGSTNKFGLD